MRLSISGLPCPCEHTVGDRRPAGSVWSADSVHAEAVAARLRTGSVAINSSAPLDFGSPFGGFKASGIGREHGHDGLDAYLETKTVWTAL